MNEIKPKRSNQLGEGSIARLYARLALPAVVAQIVNLLYNIVDRIYIGHIPGVGSSALTGVGLFIPILMLINAFAMLAAAGGAPLAAIAMGARDNERAEKILGGCFSLLMAFSVVLTVVFYIFAPHLLRFFGASDVTLPYALDYARIYILGSVFVLMVLGMNPFITTQGFAKISMLTTVIGALINIALDPVFIFAFGMGVRGAAIATVLSQAVAAAWILRFLTGEKSLLRIKKANLGLDMKVIKPCLALGVSSFVMMSTESLLSMSFTTSLARYGGDLAVGAMTIINSVAQLAVLPLQGLCQGGQPIISFNFGAGKRDRVKRAFSLQLGVCLGYASLFTALTIAFPRFFAAVFTPDAQLMDFAAWAVRIYMAGIWIFGAQIACQQSFMALGQAKISLFLACLRKLILLIPLIFILPNFFENKVFAVFLAEPISDIIAAIVTTTVFLLSFNRILEKAGK